MPKHDSALGRFASRSGRERGCRVYVPAETLQLAGIDPETVTTRRYRFWTGKEKRGRIVLQFERPER